MTKKDLQDINKFLTDLHFIQANSIVAIQLQDNKTAIAYMKRIAEIRESIKEELKNS